jgi:nucleotide-binding universal stress UspA family protein
VILLAYDGSDDSRRAVTAAGGLLGGPAVVLHVVMLDQMLAPAAAPGAALPAADLSTETELEDRGRAVAREGAELARSVGFDAEPLIRRGTGVRGVWETILDVAEERGAQAIVAGRRGVSRLESVLMGSVSNGLVQHASLPVLVVPAEQSGGR